MPLQPLYFQPGINKNTSIYSAGKTFGYGEGRVATGRYVDGDKCRFVAGFPEKIGGWTAQTEIGVTPGNCNGVIIGEPAGAKDWLAFGTPYLAIGTSTGNLYVWTKGTVASINEITPRRVRLVGTLTDPFTTTSGSAIIAVADSTQNLDNGDWVYLSTATALDGITVNGWYTVVGRTGSGYDILATTTATGSTSGGGGTVTYYYPRIQLTNALSTIIGSHTVTVVDSGHGALGNTDSIRLDTAVTVGGITLQGSYLLTITPGSTTTYTIHAATAATSTVTNGGGTFTVTYSSSVAGSLNAITMLTVDPLATTSGLPTVTVYDPNHGMGDDAKITFHNATAVAGITLNGTYAATIIDQDTYTVTASNNASSTTTGGGAVITVFKYQDNSTKTPTWSLDTFGSILVANFSGTGIYVWDASYGVTMNMAYPMLNAPSAALATFITPERFVVALGINPSSVSSTAGMTIAWSDQSNYTVWTPAVGNQANSGRVMQFGNYFIAGTAVGDGVSLMFTDTAVYEMNYTGDVSVYNTPLAASNAGIVGQLAYCVTGGIAYWIGSNREFWHYNGAVTPLPSDDIRDFIFNSFSTANAYKCVAGSVNTKKEIIFLYPTSNDATNTRYTLYHYDQNCWAIGTMTRATWRDGSTTFVRPLAMGTNGILYEHENGHDDDGSAMNSFIVTSQIDISNGARSVDILGFIPDFQQLVRSGALFVNTRYYPEDADTVDGPFIVTFTSQRQDLRSDGKEVGFRWVSNVLGGVWRLGLCRVDMQPAGARR